MTAKEKICPLCGEENHCAMAGNKSTVDKSSINCWCRDIEIDSKITDRATDDKACICQQCLRREENDEG